jgi:hypothetical protein
MRQLLVTGCALLGMSCHSRHSLDREHSDASSAAIDPAGRCQVARLAGEHADCYAVRCAEDFIRRNGYTIEPASVPQYRDAFSASMEERHGMLYSSAIVHQWISGGHFVGFRYRDSSDNVGRAVTMTSTFNELKLDHVHFVWAPDSRLPICEHDAG